MRRARTSWMVGAAMMLAACGEVTDLEVSGGITAVEELSNNTHYDGFLITNYIIARESSYSGVQICNSQGLSGCYYRDFLCSGTGVAMQGTGYANNGLYVKYSYGGGGWCNNYAYLCDCSSAVFTTVSSVTGASGRTLVADYSVAVDPAYIPLGWYVWIDGLNRWYRADDTGGGIIGYQIDVYTGFDNRGYYFNSGIYVTSTFHNATDPSPYGGGVPAQPTGLWPDGWVNVGSGSATLSWSPAAGATSYEVYIVYWNGSTWAYYYKYYPSMNYVTIWPYYHGRYYAWNVKGRNASGAGPQSAWAYFYEQ